MNTKVIGPAARTLRFVALTPILAGTILWSVHEWVPRPWAVIRFLGRDCGRDLWAMLFHIFHPGLWFSGPWYYHPRWHFYAAYRYIAGSWQASLAVGIALFVGGVAALWIDRQIVRWNRSPTKPMP